ncbi:MAG: hypothetical protein H8K06_00265 [Nitrospira sp.]|uniref:Methanolan biosynthesis EpsI domain-containing protein n=1 Tax=Nitrospira defluvii TaxID=330214 RepID=A0ABN7MA22_9BACT|nr:hypothetical protein [Nitrospira defluvii]MCS6325525.1 hypothetical protein [Nitrospira sp.]CAE6786652.1 conserved hypothetical protein [Nitrospira defluvii]
MTRAGLAVRRIGAAAVVFVAGAVAFLSSGYAESDRCPLPSLHAGVLFPLDRIDAAWACRIEPIVTHYTTANKVGPIRTPLPEQIYLYLLEHPVMAAALANRLDLGLYKAELRGPDEFWATDGEGTEGIVHPLYQDRSTRIYYVEGTHDGRFVPRVSGKALVLFKLHPVQDGQGIESTDNTMVAYLRLDNRLYAGLLSLLRPLIGNVVNRQIVKAFDAARRLAGAMRDHPDQVLFEATDPPGLPDEQVAFLKAALASLHNPGQRPGPAAP